MVWIYMDHGATTRPDPEVVNAMLPFFNEFFGNASSLHTFGQEAAQALISSRKTVADFLGAEPEEIIFTSGGTESDNLALKGIAYLKKNKGKHIITSVIEHPAILNTCKYLGDIGYRITYLPVDDQGLVDPADVEDAITDNTILISIMHANNEIGTIQPIKEISAIAHEHGVLVHTDAVQSVGKMSVNVDDLGVDMLSISAHKIYGPKGVGALYVRKGTRLQGLSQGGSHEMKKRAGTENIPGIVGMAKAVELAEQRLEGDTKYLENLRDTMIRKILDSIPESYLNGHPTKRLCNNVHVRFSYVEGESLLMMLDMKGVAVSTGSACSSKSLEPSHVLAALNIIPEEIHGNLRITLGRENTMDEVDYVVENLIDIVKKLRAMSPIAPKD
ncbi:MAG: cysteine desulfurase NifS [ANME-2 cluster archaeon]|nr:cysteine desulfurase NifS [ANME-2 cluster archaeon]MBC2700504.1 cysteine desulfurase NifS [ANME-2 cluster archaeon]MBC2707615.1 cysteine desulfurase NifS [ANME-2 cluster archaeon]MBC2748464.1 cysteine desulfurase NifS [ANME-2 cluster archaeon]MBC2761887.1 cysteine desulfurase NifS [ANME-2 cluster archaeon]